jgi:hypothetical protein
VAETDDTETVSRESLDSSSDLSRPPPTVSPFSLQILPIACAEGSHINEIGVFVERGAAELRTRGKRLYVARLWI